MAFDKYYQAELTYLREMGSAFAQAHPALAGMLAETGADPDVERLLEGFAFLSGRIRQRLDQSLPELLEGMSDLLAPQLLRSLPAASVVQFSPQVNQLRGVQRVTRGTEVRSRAVQGTECRFRTTRELALSPIEIVDHQLDDSSPTHPELCLRFRLGKGTGPGVFAHGSLRLHLHGDSAIASQLFLWLSRYVAGVSLVADGQTIPLGRQAVQPLPLDAPEGLWPWPRTAPRGQRAIAEYLCAPAAALFVDVAHLERAQSLDVEAFELRFTFRRPPALSGRPATDTFRLHCVPVVNLFDVSADPIRVEGLATGTLIRPSGVDPLHAEVFEVQRVVGVRARGKARREYAAFSGFDHGPASDSRYYWVHRERSPVDDGVHCYLSLGSPRGVPPAMDDEVLSIDLTCTNRSLPLQLHPGDIHVPTAGTPSNVAFQNIGPVSRPLRPALGSELQWRLLSQMAASAAPQLDAAGMRRTLSLYNFSDDVDEASRRANDTRIAALRGLRAESVTRIVQRAPVRGRMFRAEVDQSGFAGEGDAFLFGCALAQLLQSQAPINSFHELVVEFKPSGQRYQWTPTLG